MSPPPTLDGPRVPALAGEATRLVVLLHGLGADGSDLIALAPMLAPLLPQAAFVAPNAPYPCDMAPMGRQWFSLQQREPDALRREVESARPLLDAFLDAELARHGLSESALAIVGFSQGTMMALHTVLRRAAPCAGIAGFSGLLIGAERLAAEIRSRPPVLLVHGEADEVVPVGALPAAERALAAAGVPVTAHRRPGLGHGIDNDGLALAAGFLGRCLGGAGEG